MGERELRPAHTPHETDSVRQKLKRNHCELLATLLRVAPVVAHNCRVCKTKQKANNNKRSGNKQTTSESNKTGNRVKAKAHQSTPAIAKDTAWHGGYATLPG